MHQQTVLLIEDNRVLAKIFAEVLERTGRIVTLIYDGREAQTYLKQNIPDLLIIDLHIPEVSGMQLIQEITADERFSQTKLIVTTADSFLGNKIKSWHPNIHKVLLKPVAFDILLKEIESP